MVRGEASKVVVMRGERGRRGGGGYEGCTGRRHWYEGYVGEKKGRIGHQEMGRGMEVDRNQTRRKMKRTSRGQHDPRRLSIGWVGAIGKRQPTRRVRGVASARNVLKCNYSYKLNYNYQTQPNRCPGFEIKSALHSHLHC